MTVFELAKKYYPEYWDIARLETLIEAGRLTEEEVVQIVEEYTDTLEEDDGAQDDALEDESMIEKEQEETSLAVVENNQNESWHIF